MASTQSAFVIDVNVNNINSSPTTPRNGSKILETKIQKKIQQASKLLTASIISTTLSIGKTYVNAQFNKTENANQAKRFNLGIQITSQFLTIAGSTAYFGGAGLVGSSMIVAGTYVKSAVEYNTFLEKRELRFNYINTKYRQNTANGTRWRGGSI